MSTGTSDLRQHFEAVESRQHHIQDDGAPRLFGGRLHTLGAGVHGAHRVAHRIQIVGDQAAEFAVVVNEEHAGWGGSCGAMKVRLGHGRR